MGRSAGLAMPIALVLLAATGVPAADQIVKLYSGGELVNCTPAARVRGGVTYAPLRAAVDAVGAHVTWNAKERQAVICTDTQCVPIRADQGIMVGSSLLVPVRLLGEALGRRVRWDGAARAVRISDKAKGLL